MSKVNKTYRLQKYKISDYFSFRDCRIDRKMLIKIDRDIFL